MIEQKINQINRKIYQEKKNNKSTFWWLSRLLTLAGCFCFGIYFVVSKLLIHGVKYKIIIQNASFIFFLVFTFLLLLEFSFQAVHQIESR